MEGISEGKAKADGPTSREVGRNLREWECRAGGCDTTFRTAGIQPCERYGCSQERLLEWLWRQQWTGRWGRTVWDVFASDHPVTESEPALCGSHVWGGNCGHLLLRWRGEEYASIEAVASRRQGSHGEAPKLEVVWSLHDFTGHTNETQLFRLNTVT